MCGPRAGPGIGVLNQAGASTCNNRLRRGWLGRFYLGQAVVGDSSPHGEGGANPPTVVACTERKTEIQRDLYLPGQAEPSGCEANLTWEITNQSLYININII